MSSGFNSPTFLSNLGRTKFDGPQRNEIPNHFTFKLGQPFLGIYLLTFPLSPDGLVKFTRISSIIEPEKAIFNNFIQTVISRFSSPRPSPYYFLGCSIHLICSREYPNQKPSFFNVSQTKESPNTLYQKKKESPNTSAYSFCISSLPTHSTLAKQRLKGKKKKRSTSS